MSRGDDDRAGRRVRAFGPGTALGLALLAVWAGWWVESARRDRLVIGRLAWMPALPFLAGDFTVSIDHTARLFAAGGDPYRRDDWVCAVFPYPPMVPRVFAWVSLVDTPTAARVWLSALAAVLAAGGVAAWKTRRELGLSPIPLSWALAAALYSTPAVMAMERGQCDPLAVPALVAVSWLLRRRSPGRDVAAGALLGLTAWLKYYPGFAAVGLLALGRRRALAAFVAAAGLVGLIDLADVRRSVANGAAVSARVRALGPGACFPWGHSFDQGWPALWAAAPSPWRRLGSVPDPLVAAALILPAVALVSRRVGRARDPGPLVAPLLLWLTAAATFAMPFSTDYNLVPLPLAALAVWDRRDRPAVHAAMGALLPWWQPVALPVEGCWLFLVKLAGLYAVGASLAARALSDGPSR
jgi:hypothetical protein